MRVLASCERVVRYSLYGWKHALHSRCYTHHSMPQLVPDYPGHKPPRWGYVPSFLPVIALILLFSFFLSSYSLLSHSKSPAIKQHIGWQAWDVVDMTSQKEVEGNEDSDIGIGNSNGTETNFIPSIPLDNWVSTTRFSVFWIADAQFRILWPCILLDVSKTSSRFGSSPFEVELTHHRSDRNSCQILLLPSVYFSIILCP